MPVGTNANKEKAMARLEGRIDSLNVELNVGLNYDVMARDMEAIFGIENSAEKNAKIAEFYTNLGRSITEKLYDRRSYIWSLDSLKKAHENEKDPAVNYSVLSAQKVAREITERFCEIHQPGYVEQNPTFGMDSEKEDSWMMDEVNKHTYVNDVKKNMMKWNLEGFAEDIKNTKAALSGYNVSVVGIDGKSEENMKVAELYHKNNVVKAELAKHGFFWRLFHPKITGAYKTYIAESQKLLTKVRFNPSIHAAPAKKVLENVMPPYNTDRENVEDYYIDKDAQKQNAKASETNAPARNSVYSADKNPENSFMSKISDIAEKYGIAKNNYEINSNISDYDTIRDAKEAYQNTNDADAMRRYVGRAFLNGYKAIIESSAKNGKAPEIAEALTDARKIAVTAGQHYMKTYDVKELSNLGKPLYSEYLDASLLKDHTRSLLENNRPKNSATLENYAIDRMCQDVEKVMKSWNGDLENLANEDKAFAKELGASIPAADGKNIDNNANRQSLVVDELNEKINIKEVEPKKEEISLKNPVKSIDN